MESRLIEAIKQFPEIYCPQDPGYKDLRKNEEAWKDVVSMVGADRLWCQKKWKELKDTLVQMTNQLPLRDSELVSIKDNVFQQQMGFLLPYIHQQRSQKSHETQFTESLEENTGNTDESPDSPSGPAVDEAASVSTASSPQRFWETRRRSPSFSPTRSSSSARYRPYNSLTEAALLVLLRRTAPPRPYVPNEAEGVYHFALSLVPSLIGIPSQSRSRVQMSILHVILKAAEAERMSRAEEHEAETRDFRPEGHGQQRPPQ